MEKPLVLALGNFDGVHKGHQHLISEAIKEAKQCRGSSAVMILTRTRARFFPRRVHCY